MVEFKKEQAADRADLRAFIGLFYPRNLHCILHHAPWNEQSIRGFTDEGWGDDDDGSTSYKEFYYGRLHHERRNGLGTHRTSSFTKMVGRKAKWVSPAIITERREKRTCFRCRIVGHRMDKYIFLPARRPVATATTTKTVIKFTGSSIMVDSTTSDEMDWNLPMGPVQQRERQRSRRRWWGGKQNGSLRPS